MLTSTLRRIAPLAFFGLYAACGQPLDSDQDGLPQNEALDNAPEGILFLDEQDALPPDFVAQAITTTEQNAMLAAVNLVRAKGAKCGTTTYPAATKFVSNALLIKAADAHGNDMAAKNYFSHTGADGSSPGTRITRTGYKWSTYGENIAAGYSSVQAAVDGWYKSEGHCKNFMNKNLTQAGFGKGYNAGAMWKYYWVAVLARPL